MLDQIIYFDRSFMAHKIVNQQCPESLWNKYTQWNEISRYNTRNNRNLDIPKFKLECTKKGFHLSGLKVWDEIPIEIRETPSLYQFKRKLKTHLKSSANPYWNTTLRKIKPQTKPNPIVCFVLSYFIFSYLLTYSIFTVTYNMSWWDIV